MDSRTSFGLAQTRSINHVYAPHQAASSQDLYEQLRSVLGHLEVQMALITGTPGQEVFDALPDRMRDALLHACGCQVREAIDLCDTLASAVTHSGAH